MNTVQVKNIVIGEGRPKICVPIVGKTKTDILEEAKKITTLPVDVVEWRVDWFDDVFATEKVLETAKELQEVLKDIQKASVMNCAVISAVKHRHFKTKGSLMNEPEKITMICFIKMNARIGVIKSISPKKLLIFRLNAWKK